LNAEDLHLVPLYQKFPIKIVRGDGATLYDDHGKDYIDLSGGYGVAIIGHSNPKVAKAVADQAAKLITCHGSLYNDARERYIRLITQYLPGDLSRLYFCNSGAEANEAAIKFARKATGRPNIVAFTGSYHGKTIGALSTTWNQKYRKPFEPLMQGVRFVPFGNLAKASEQIDETVAAVIVEPIQGESGIHVPPDDFLPGLRNMTSSKNALLIFDEVQSGFGRTGKLWACENWGVSPDILTASKGVAGGVPFAFTACTESVSSAMKLGEHTSTFGGNPLSCAAATAALEYLFEEHLLGKAVENGAYFASLLRGLKEKHPAVVRDVRGKGMMLAVELRIPVKDVIMKGFEHNLILLYAGLNVLRFLAPLVITRSQLETVAKELDLILGEVEQSSSARSQAASEEEVAAS
jgi:LysW-gamma-L-lysine/LysW-L-ornithine aminotransferase